MKPSQPSAGDRFRSAADGPIDRYAVVGNPVSHSQSPFIHAAFARSCGQQLHYGRLLCPLDAFDSTLRAFVASPSGCDDAGGSVVGPVRGCNITVPFKLAAFAMADRRSERAALAEAANVLCFDAQGWRADNTDGVGLVRDIEDNAGVSLAGRRVLLIGAGGAAAGAIGALLQARPTLLVVANRTLGKAAGLVERHAALATRCQVDLQAAELDTAGSAYDIVINASASSLQGAAVPVSAAVLRPGSLALDMMYGPAAGSFLGWAAAHGARGRDGLGMLVEQAAEAFRLWRGQQPPTSEVLLALRQRLAAAGR